MKLEVGQFVRTKNGYISQYKYYDTTNAYMEKLLCIPLSNGTFANIEDIIKASYNIIDILEVGDYVNELPVEDYYTRYDEEKDDYIKIGIVTLEDYWKGTFTSVEDIKSIVTKEQFESMSYKVGE